MTLKEKISKDFIDAYKGGDKVRKTLLSVIKAEITTTEKNNSISDLSDQEIIKILLKTSKNLNETISLSGSTEAKAELLILEEYLPKKLSEEEIESKLISILGEVPSDLPKGVRIGKAMGEFNKKNPGMAEGKTVSGILNKLVS
jgi:uncharacterized protein YqeY